MGRPTYSVIGDPVEHSLSPRLFAWLFAEARVDAHYTALRVRPEELPEAIARVRRGALAGLSVTIPHKEAVIPLLDDVHPLAARIGAVNCVARTPEGKAHGFNTDAPGLRLALEGAGLLLAGARVLVIGAGGAGRAAAFAAVAGGAKALVLANRTHDRAVRLGLELVEDGGTWPEGELRRRWEAGERAPPRPRPRRLGELGARDASAQTFVTVVPLEAEALAQAVGHADVLVHATSVGLRDPAASPLPAGVRLHGGLTVLDMIYRPLETALLARARAAGARPVDGLWMLVHQGIEQLRLWTGRTVPPATAARLHDHLREASA